MLLTDIDQSKPLFALQVGDKSEIETELRKMRYQTRRQIQLNAERIERDERDQKRRQRRRALETCGKHWGKVIGLVLLVALPLSWYGFGVYLVYTNWNAYESGALQGSCKSTHLFEACVTQLALSTSATLSMCMVFRHSEASFGWSLAHWFVASR